MAYVPPAHDGKFKIDMSVVRGNVIAEWMDPSTGEKKKVRNISAGEFTTPGKNKSGYSDWVLIVRGRE